MKTTLMILSMVWHMMHSLLFRQRLPQSRNTRSVTHSQGETQTCPKHPQADNLTDSPASPAQAAPTAQTTPTGQAAQSAQRSASPNKERSEAGRKQWPLMDSRQRTVRFNEQFLATHYDLRYNTMKVTTEFRRKSDGPDAPWCQLTERDLNSMTVEQLMAGGDSWGYGMRLCIDSAAVPNYNPVTDYLLTCPSWDGTDHIGAMARRVPTTYERWPEFFHRWVLALTAQALGMKAARGNSMVPMLIGPQGTRKSTFCRNIMPPELREYFADDIKMDNAEQVERMLGRMWLVCIDEYNSKTPREQAKIKRLLTESDVQVRRMRSDQYTLTRRMASFIATTNDDMPLPSGDGTRRYLCIAVEGNIDTTGTTDWRQLFAQAQAELRQEGCRFWFDDDDEREIQEHNKPFQQMSSLESVLPTLFEPTADRRAANLWQVLSIQKELAKVMRPTDVPSLRHLAAALKALHWSQGIIVGRRGYFLSRKEKE